jgi:Rad3-related DNA helicase
MAPDATQAEQILRGSGGLRGSRAPRFRDSVEKITEMHPARVKRSRKREIVGTIVGQGVQTWWATGLKGEKNSRYEVRFDGDTWDCTCYHEDYGETRRAQVCSHVLAVWLYVKEGGGAHALTDSSNGDGATEEIVGTTPVAPSPAPSKKPKKDKKDKKKGKRKKDKHKAKKKPKKQIALLHPSDAAINPDGWSPVPFEEYRPDQVHAALEVMDAFRDGAKVVFVDAPTGAGKTGIADLVSRLSFQPSVFMCSTKSLQEQVVETFDYAKVLKGRANYATMHAPFPEVTCDDCTASSVEANDCMWCEPVAKCPYRVAKAEAMRAQVAVLNTAYWIREANHAQGFSIPPMEDPRFARPGSRRQGYGGLFIVDECDLMKNALYGYVEFAVTERRARDLMLTVPKKGSHKSTIARWMKEEFIPAAAKKMHEETSVGTVEAMRRARGFGQLIQQADEISGDIEGDNWIRDNSNDRVPLSMKPIKVDAYAPELVWSHTGRTLMMSATIISPEEMADTLGVQSEYRTVTVPMRFPVENREIIAAPVADMRGGEAKGKESGAWNDMVLAIANISDRHAGEKMLVHTVSYALAKHIMLGLRHAVDRELFTYTNAGERDGALARFRGSASGIMVASSLDRGIDLADDDCRVVIVAKIPFPNLGDPQVSALLHAPGGEETYAVETVRTLVQMTGRGVRHMEDRCTTYVLDAQFTRNILRRHRNLLPGWWRDALNTGFNTNLLLRERG